MKMQKGVLAFCRDGDGSMGLAACGSEKRRMLGK